MIMNLLGDQRHIEDGTLKIELETRNSLEQSREEDCCLKKLGASRGRGNQRGILNVST